ncbi:antibiotic biosynthesis monooxygenase family protein [Parapedobacter tibetensis]|uniref:antibiotic biosynthesis monooxygenase family protein n=1 Tax=Parapedobacter tibetensis TaxID=2972951 RepID=UPI00214D4271|nr:antibiotic biosynthesis monooxygenase [Parapedobacter tibetensis]
MIHEVAILNVKMGLEDKFEQDFVLASRFISAIVGYKGHTLRKCMEEPGKYILLVDWETLTDHTVGFRSSPEYLEWKSLLHHYYDPFPTIEHYETVFAKRN